MNIKTMTDKQIVTMLGSNTPIDKARQVFSSQAARIHNAYLQRLPPTPVEVRRMEFEAVQKIAEALGVNLA